MILGSISGWKSTVFLSLDLHGLVHGSWALAEFSWGCHSCSQICECIRLQCYVSAYLFCCVNEIFLLFSIWSPYLHWTVKDVYRTDSSNCNLYVGVLYYLHSLLPLWTTVDMTLERFWWSDLVSTSNTNHCWSWTWNDFDGLIFLKQCVTAALVVSLLRKKVWLR